MKEKLNEMKKKISKCGWATKSVAAMPTSGQGSKGHGGVWLQVRKELHWRTLPDKKTDIDQWAAITLRMHDVGDVIFIVMYLASG
eukprot:4897770-Pyramimonas_sp.AAC.1